MWAVVQVCHAQLPNYVPPSPQAATFLKYRDYPVDLSTGLVDITIPLLDLGLKSYKIPINARFHASGRKIDMSYSELGLGWKLDAYGIITREVRGKSDWTIGGTWGTGENEYNGDYFTASSTDNEGDRQNKLKRRSGLELSSDAPSIDGEYDIFTISFQGISSSFIMRNNEAVFLNYFPYKVVFSSGKFTVWDDKGIQYIFGSHLENGTTYGSSIAYNNSQITGDMSWYIAKILTPQKDYVRFTYGRASSDGVYLGGNMNYGATAKMGDYALQFGSNQGADYSQMYGQYLTFNVQNTNQNEAQSIAYLKMIESSNGNFSFSYNSPYYSLDEISYSNSSGILKKVKFIYQNIADISFTIPNNQGKTLQEIRFLGSDGMKSHSYNLEYYQGTIPATGISEYGYGRDYWGYANFNTNYNIIPVDQVVQRTGMEGAASNYNRTVGSSARRAPNYSAKLLGMLKKIKYPTGGESEFFYEANRYNVPGTSNSAEGPGLRIAQVRQSDGSGGKSINKFYKYGSSEDGVGYLARNPVAGDFQMTQFVTHIPYLNGIMTAPDGYLVANAFRYRYREFYSEPLSYIRQAYNIPIYYSYVTEYQRDDDGNNLGKTIYDFYIPYYEVEPREFYDGTTGDRFDLSKFVPNYSLKSNIGKIEVYSVSDNIFTLKKRTTYSYITKKSIKLPQVTYFRRHRVNSERFGGDENYEENIIETKYPNPSTAHQGLLFPWNTVAVRDYKLSSASVVVDSIAETDYSSAVPVSKTVSYLYDSPYTDKPSEIRERNSLNGLNITKISYPDDILSAQALTGGAMGSDEFAAVTQMKKASGNFASVPIQTENYYSSGTLRSLLRSGYKIHAGVSHHFRDAEKKGNDDVLRPIYEILSFDTYGNALEIREKNGAITAYLWGYNGQYPVAEAVNATYNDIAFTGFEADDSGGWTWTGQVVRGNNNSYDGENFLGLSPGQSISKAGLNAAKKYRISVWLWGNIAPSGYTVVATKGNWTNYEKIVTGLTTFTLSYAESINGMVDNISISPLEAQMTTYTYKPLVGITTKTDSRGLTEYYEYDSLGRLSLIKDFNGHILKDFLYHYKP
ncbi:hypothetical protein D3C87_524000 [compost metagenome]